MDDQSLLSIRNNRSLININDENMYAIVKKFQQFKTDSGGETGIRTQEKSCPFVTGFKTGAFNRSAISP